jgi:hypothetical protein
LQQEAAMSDIIIAESQVKEVFKQALLEVLQEREEWFHDLIAEVIEELALARAIKEGEAEEIVGREEVFNILEGKA